MPLCPHIGAYMRVRNGVCISCPQRCPINYSIESPYLNKISEPPDPFAKCKSCAHSEIGLISGQLQCNEQWSFKPKSGGCDDYAPRC